MQSKIQIQHDELVAFERTMKVLEAIAGSDVTHPQFRQFAMQLRGGLNQLRLLCDEVPQDDNP